MKASFFHDLVELKTQRNHLVVEANQEKLDYIALRCRLASHLNQKLHKNQSRSEQSVMTKEYLLSYQYLTVYLFEHKA